MIGDGALDRVAEVFETTFGDSATVVVADENTFDAAGESVTRELSAGGPEVVEPFVFPGQPTLHADYENIKALARALHEHNAIPVAVGSGTINDIVKRASHECERPYMTVATAASMDGYTSFGASITKDGFKQTMECSAPRAAVADLAVLMKAPPGMTSSGYGDLLAKITAGADWILADALEVEPIKDKEWSLVQGPLRAATDHPADLHAGDAGAMEALIEALIMSGLAMQAASSSRPASGAEHEFSHLWEMEGLGDNPEKGHPPLSHGFKVAVGTVSIAALYERVLARDLDSLDIAAAVRAWPSWDDVEGRVHEAFAGTPLRTPRSRRRARSTSTRTSFRVGSSCSPIDGVRPEIGSENRYSRPSRYVRNWSRRMSVQPAGDRAGLKRFERSVPQGADDPPALHNPRFRERGRHPRRVRRGAFHRQRVLG